MAKRRGVKGDIDQIRQALRPRMKSVGGAVTTPSNVVPPHTHHASAIIVEPEPTTALVSADDVQEALEEIGTEKLARSGEQPWVGPDPLDMADFEIVNVDAIHPTLAPDYDHEEGALYWNEDESIRRWAIDVDNNTRLHWGGVYVRVANFTGLTIPALRPVRMESASGGISRVELAGVSGGADLDDIGLTMHEIADQEEGWVCCHGTIGGLDTPIDTTAWAPGDVLYVGAAGTLATNPPGKGCGVQIRMGYVVHSQDPYGELFVDVERMPNLRDLSDLDITAVGDGGPEFYDHPQWLSGVDGCDAWRDYPASLFPIREVSADFDVLEKNVMVLVDASGGDVTGTLPTTVGSSARHGRVVHIKKVDATRNRVIIEGNGGGDTIDGEATQSLVLPGEGMTVLCVDGGEWRVMP